MSGAAMDYGYNLTNYRAVLAALKAEGYRFASYCDPAPQGKCVFLRHDIDLSLEYAERFARINAETGAVGTFFLQLRCEMYNLLAFETLAAVERIAALGQHIGFHAVIRPGATVVTLAEDLHRDFALFRALIPRALPVFAWHNPSILQAEGFAHLEAEFEGLANAYGVFCGGKHPYYADSNMRWSFSQIMDLVRGGEPVFQLALAPMQWCPEEADMPGVLASSLMLRLSEMERALRLNHVYKERLPGGLPEPVFRSIRATLDRNLGGGRQ